MLIDMTHVTPQTAAALEAAGFPQPKPAIGQHWYSRSRSRSGGPYLHYIQDGSSPIFAAGQPTPEWLAFAPTAEDILNALGMGWCAIVFSPPEESPQSWCCCHFEDGAFSQHRWSASLAEACASAYLDKHPLK